MTQEAPRHRPRTFVWLYIAGTALTFGLTLIASVKTGKLYQVFLQGSAPGVCLQAAGLYGFCVSRWQDRDRWPLAETVSKASFCIYLTHLFFLEFLAGRGLAAGLLPPVWAVPLLAAAAFGGTMSPSTSPWARPSRCCPAWWSCGPSTTTGRPGPALPACGGCWWRSPG